MPPRRPRHPAVRVAASALLGLALLPATAAAQAGPLVPKRCASSADLPRTARCGTVSVPLDHSGATPGRLSLNVAVLPATGARRGTLAVLTGGPGQPAVAPGAERGLGDANETLDVLLVDQRGSGGSDATRCGSTTTAAGVRRCAEALGPRRPFLTTKETALDLEDVRAAVGAERLSLLGISYGAKVAGEYARRFPGRTERIVLDSPAPVDGLDTSLKLRQLGLPRVLAEVCEPDCESFISDPSVALRTLVRRLARGALRGRAVLPSGRTRAARVTVDDLFALVVLSDLDPQLRSALPAAVTSGVLGDAAPLLRLLAGARAADEEAAGAVDESRLLATSCVEGRLPWAPDSPVDGRAQALARALAAAPARTFAPFRRETVASVSLAALCSAWPPTPAPEPVPAAPGPDVPVLVLSGREDLRTPLEDARRTAAQYPRATLLPVPGVGHSVLVSDSSACSEAALSAFLLDQPVRRCRGVGRLPAFAFVPASLGQLRAARGVDGVAGRVATAVTATLADLGSGVFGGFPTDSRIARTIRVPGLRGGIATLAAGRGLRVSLRGYEVIRGVRVSGVLRSASGTLAVVAPGGVTGVLRLARSRVTGVIGGQGVSFRVG